RRVQRQPRRDRQQREPRRQQPPSPPRPEKSLLAAGRLAALRADQPRRPRHVIKAPRTPPPPPSPIPKPPAPTQQHPNKRRRGRQQVEKPVGHQGSVPAGRVWDDWD